MRKVLYFAFAAFAALACNKQENAGTDYPALPEIDIDTSTRQLIVTDQSSNTLRIYDQPTRLLLWSWSASESNILAEHQQWFDLPDECKPVMDCNYILTTASKGGVALIDIKSKKVIFYACPSNNPHSAEILPDGNIVVAASGGYLSLYKFDPASAYVPKYIARYDFEEVHNVVWDAARECLWSCGASEMRKYSYDGKSLNLIKSIPLPAMWAHDLVPWRDGKKLVVTTGSTVNLFDPEIMEFTTASCFKQTDIKSVSFGPVAICTTPVESWWTPEVLNFNTGERVFFKSNLQMYKARWRIENTFSYGK